MKRTNIMLTDDQYNLLKSYSKQKQKTLGELVRIALDATYRERASLEKRKSTALEAYQEGLISIGKLAEILGMDVVTTRLYLKNMKMSLHTQTMEDIRLDAENA
jgi:predicted HTH domain antitoxin